MEVVRAVFIACAIGVVFTAGAPAQSHVPSWVGDAVFYQIFPERFANGDPSNDPPRVLPWGGTPTNQAFFGGDLAGIIDHLDHLQSLGITAVYLNPIFLSPSNHKYNTTDYMRIDPAFGDEAAFRMLVNECHARGIRIVLDGVFNHTSVDFFAFADLRKRGERSVHRTWYNVYSYPVAPPQTPNYECWWGYGSMPKLMTGDPSVRSYLFGVTRKWMSFGIDGWRLDVANEIPHEFWIAWRALVKSINPDAYICAEIWDNASAWLKGNEFDATMNYRFRTAVLAGLAARTMPLSRMDSTLNAQWKDYGPGVNHALLNLLGSHDTERILTAARGDTAAVRQALLFQFTYPGAPMLYYGDEFGMKGDKDPGCRGTMVWDRARQDSGMFQYVQSVIALRRSHPVWSRGDFRTLLVDDARRVYAYERTGMGVRGVVVINDGQEDTSVRIPSSSMKGIRCSEVWPSVGAPCPAEGGCWDITVPARCGRVFLEVKQ
jgi:cyclomaltodextrinase / maltogenic alpha-amylase / neopullulanase